VVGVAELLLVSDLGAAMLGGVSSVTGVVIIVDKVQIGIPSCLRNRLLLAFTCSYYHARKTGVRCAIGRFLGSGPVVTTCLVALWLL